MFDGILCFWKLCWKHNKKYISYLGLNQVIKVSLSVIALFFPQLILDALFTHQHFEEAIKLIASFISLSFLLGSIAHFVTKKCTDERMKTFHRFQLDLSAYMMSIRLEHIETNDFLNLKAKAEHYLYGGGQGFASVLENGFDMGGILLTLLIYATTISKLNIFILFFLIILVCINTIFNYRFQKKNITINLEKATQERKSSYFMDVFQNFTYGKEIRVNNLTDWLIGKYNVQLTKMQKFYKSLSKNHFIYSLVSSFLSILQQIASYFYLFREVVRGNLSVGLFSLYLNAIMSFNSSIKQLISQVISIRQYTDYYNAYAEYISIKNIDKSSSASDLKDDKIISDVADSCVIEFKNVGFRYPQNTYDSLYGVNAIIKNGDRIAVVGHNGAGKSTFIKLLLRIYQPSEGIITINGINIWDISLTCYLKLFSTVFQDYKLFAQSIKENITFCEESNTERVSAILSELKMNTKIDSFAQKFDTNLYKTFDNQGYVPSEGEAQKIAIARAIYKNAFIVILDEPSSALDPQSEYELYLMFDKMTTNKTSIFISHRLSITSISNKILVFEKGTIVESGTHDQLIQQGGLYSSMYQKQVGFYDKEIFSKLDFFNQKI